MSYRLLLLAKNGHLVGHTTVNCLDDEEAIAVAKHKVRKCEYVEVWRGGRPVCMCARSLKLFASLETASQPRNPDAEAAKAKARMEDRFG